MNTPEVAYLETGCSRHPRYAGRTRSRGAAGIGWVDETGAAEIAVVSLVVVCDGARHVGRARRVDDPLGAPSRAIIVFDDCDARGPTNLRGTAFAARDIARRTLTGRLGGVRSAEDVNVAGLAGCLHAEVAAARERPKAKDWYDLACVLLHNDAGGVDCAVARVLRLFGPYDLRELQTAIRDLAASFADGSTQRTRAYVEQLLIGDPPLDAATTAARQRARRLTVLTGPAGLSVRRAALA